MIGNHRIIETKKAIWYTLSLAVVLRILLPLIAFIRNKNFSIFYSNDSDKYISLAKTLLEKRVFSYDGSFEIERTPGYPIFLMLGIKLGQLEIVTTIIQVVLSCLTIYLVFKISLLIFQKNEIAILSSLLCAFEPLSILYSSKLLPETLFTMLVVLSLYLLTKYFNDKNLINLIVSSIALSMSAYVRPNSILLSLVITIILFLYFFYTYKQRNTSQIVAPFLFLLLFTSLTGIWQIRNSSVANYNGFSAIGDRAVYELSVEHGISNYETKNQRSDRERREEFFWNHPEKRVEKYKFFRDEGYKMILNNLPVYFLMHLKGMGMLILNPGLTEFLRMLNLNYFKTSKIIETYFDIGFIGVLYKILKEIPIIFLLFVFSSLITLIYFLLTLTTLTSKKLLTVELITIISIVIYLFVIASFEGGRSRYRQPIMPLVSILAGYSLRMNIDKLTKK